MTPCAGELTEYQRIAANTQPSIPAQNSPPPQESAGTGNRTTEQKPGERPGELVSMTNILPTRDVRRRSSRIALSEADFLNSEHDRSSAESRPGVVSLSYMMSVWDRDNNENVSPILPPYAHLTHLFFQHFLPIVNKSE